MIQNPKIKYIGVHHTASSRMSGRNQLNAVDTYHKNKNWGTVKSPFVQDHPSSLGWYVGYNYFVDVDGTVTNTRAVGEETIANVGHNCDTEGTCDTVSICVAGDFNQELLNDSEILSLRTLIRECQTKYPQAQVVFHRDLQPGRTCAGILFTKEYMDIRILEKGIKKLDKTDAEKKIEIGKLMEYVSLLRKLKELLTRKK